MTLFLKRYPSCQRRLHNPAAGAFLPPRQLVHFVGEVDGDMRDQRASFHFRAYLLRHVNHAYSW